MQVLLGSLLPLLVFALGQRLFSRKAGLLAAATSALYLPFVFYDALLMKTSLALFVLVLAMIVLIEASKKKKTIYWLTGGGILGLSALLRPNVLLFLPLAAGGILWIERKEGVRKAIGHVLALVLGFLILLAPVTLRNVSTGDFVLIGSNGGFNFYIGNHPHARPVYQSIPGISATILGEQTDTRRIAEAETGKALRPSQVSSFWLGKGLLFVKEHPRQALLLFLEKVLLSLNRLEVPNTESFYFAREHASVLRLPLFTFFSVLPLGLLGIGFRRSRKSGRILVDLFLLSTLITLSAFYVTARYRLPAAPFLIVYAAQAAIMLWEKAKAARFGQLILPLLVAGVISGVSALNVYPHMQSRFAPIHINAAVCYQHMGLHDKALEALDRAREGQTGDSRIPELMGVSFAEQGDFNRALACFRQALALEPANPASIHYRMGALFLKQRDLERAEKAFLEAIARDPSLARAHAYMGVIRRLQGDEDSAVRYLTRAKALQPDWPLIYLELARAYRLSGDLKRARNVLKEGLRLAPGHRAMQALMEAMK